MVDDFQVEIPQTRIDDVKNIIDIVGGDSMLQGPFLDGVQPMTDDPLEATLNKTWRPTVTYVGIDGIPCCKDGGNVLRVSTTLKISVRLPPSLDPDFAVKRIKEIVEADPPYGAHVEYQHLCSGGGFDAPEFPAELTKVLNEACQANYDGNLPCSYGMGGSIPLMGDLAKQFPEAKFMVTGVLGPESNAHGPNEFLHLPFLEKMINTLVRFLAEGRDFI